jgi:predicted ArsR family transcriptional regulator
MTPTSRWSGHKVLVEGDLRRVFDSAGRDLGTIDAQALAVLQRADGSRTADTIAAELGSSIEAVRQAFDRLRALSLLDSWTAPPTESQVVSRRRAVFDLARAAAVAGTAAGAFAALGSGDAWARVRGGSQEHSAKR